MDNRMKKAGRILLYVAIAASSIFVTWELLRSGVRSNHMLASLFVILIGLWIGVGGRRTGKRGQVLIRLLLIFFGIIVIISQMNLAALAYAWFLIVSPSVFSLVILLYRRRQGHEEFSPKKSLAE